MTSVLIISVVASLMLILSVFLFLGKGSWLIAGYNTASADEKATYDKKKLCRAVGVFCLIISVMLYAMSYFGYKVESGIFDEGIMLPFAVVFVFVIVASLIALNIYINKKCIK